MNNLSNKLLVDAQEVSKLLCIGKTLFYSLHSEGKIPAPIKLGARVLWSLDDLKKWVEAECPDRMTWSSKKKHK